MDTLKAKHLKGEADQDPRGLRVWAWYGQLELTFILGWRWATGTLYEEFHRRPSS
jgi:hypothetical protein